jgi:hypothetical protein
MFVLMTLVCFGACNNAKFRCLKKPMTDDNSDRECSLTMDDFLCDRSGGCFARDTAYCFLEEHYLLESTPSTGVICTPTSAECEDWRSFDLKQTGPRHARALSLCTLTKPDEIPADRKH